VLGVCYYPEHWKREMVREDFRKMKELGIQYVRMGEFAWSRIEPSPGKFDWEWLDEVLDWAYEEGLKVILGTPTATPPKWLVDRHPEILPVDREGRVKKFGSRRHYCFSSPVYREEARRIVTLMAKRYGKHPAVVGWQTDNEYGCHDTTRCYCERCKKAFQRWLEVKYGDIESLNKAWGTVFWSQEYRSFDEIELPNLTVADPNPAHVLDFFRFSSDQIRSFNRMQVEIIREHSPGRFITHNFMGGFTEFDHYALSQNLDFASWDNYPLGHTAVFLKMLGEKENPFARVGHPDFAAFCHDLYRGVGKGRFWVMEQQVGPVNWAPYNPCPADGVVRLWTWEAFAHGAEVVTYFRWRQVPFAQEQMHSGILWPDSSPTPGYHEVKRVAEELKRIELPSTRRSPVALIFDYEAAWVFSIQPHGEGIHYLDLVIRFYTALRRLGIDVDVVPPIASLHGYKFVVVPSLPIVRKEYLDNFEEYEGFMVFGPRTGSKTEHFQIPPELPPGILQSILPLKVTHVESLGPIRETVLWGDKEYHVGVWKEWIRSSLEPIARFSDGRGALFRNRKYFYIAFWPTEEFLMDLFEQLADEAGLKTNRLPEGVRVRKRGDLTFAFNYTDRKVTLPFDGVNFLIGGRELEPYGVSIWREPGGS